MKEPLTTLSAFPYPFSFFFFLFLSFLLRALGDHDLASKGVICRPHIKYVPNFRDSHRYLIMASDGLWDHVQEGEALKIVNDVLG